MQTTTKPTLEDEANRLYEQACEAILQAKLDNRITDYIAEMRFSYITERIAELQEPLQRIAAARAMISACERMKR